MKIRLEELDAKSKSACAAFVKFVNANYDSKIPMEESAVRSGATICFWAVDEATGKKVGTTGYVKKTRFLAESVKTVVAASHRGKGLGAKLSEAIEREVRRRGFKKIMSTIYISNIAMIVIKLKQGYIIEGTHFDHEKPGLHEYSLGKRLT